MKKVIILLISMMVAVGVLAQDTYDERHAIEIKKNPEYFYAEHENADVAFDMLMNTIRKSSDFDSPIDSSVTTVWQKAESFGYQQADGDFVTLFYVLKKDLVIGETADNTSVVLDNSVELIESGSIIETIIGYKNYEDVWNYIYERKDERHDIQFKLIRGDDGTRNCYWIVFDRDKNIIAVLNRTLDTDLLTNQPVDYTRYINYPKIWLQIF